MKAIYHNSWLQEIEKYIDADSPEDIIRYCMSYTLQSLRANEDMQRFSWGDTP